MHLRTGTGGHQIFKFSMAHSGHGVERFRIFTILTLSKASRGPLERVTGFQMSLTLGSSLNRPGRPFSETNVWLRPLFACMLVTQMDKIKALALG